MHVITAHAGLWALLKAQRPHSAEVTKGRPAQRTLDALHFEARGCRLGEEERGEGGQRLITCNWCKAQVCSCMCVGISFSSQRHHSHPPPLDLFYSLILRLVANGNVHSPLPLPATLRALPTRTCSLHAPSCHTRGGKTQAAHQILLGCACQ